MNKVKLEILGLSSSHLQSSSFALVLGEFEGKRRLPIIIGMFEAQAIAIVIEKILPNRPMTHDLFKFIADKLSYKVVEIIISDIKEGVFFSKIVFQSNDKKIEIDARPSDAIAIGLRFDAPIYTYDHILNDAGVLLSDESDDHKSEVQDFSVEINRPSNSNMREKIKREKDNFMKDLSVEKLNELLNKAIENEDYEQAAKIRDELHQRS